MQTIEQIKQSYGEQPHWLLRYWWVWVYSYVIPFTIMSNFMFWWVMDDYYNISKQPAPGVTDEMVDATAWMVFWSWGRFFGLSGLALALIGAWIVHSIIDQVSKYRVRHQLYS